MASNGSGQVSMLADMLKKQQGSKFTPKGAFEGWSRGMKGQLGQKLFKGRNASAGLNKEREVLQSPIMKSFMERNTPQTPITNMLRGGR
jgi:hypothetical protein